MRDILKTNLQQKRKFYSTLIDSHNGRPRKKLPKAIYFRKQSKWWPVILFHIFFGTVNFPIKDFVEKGLLGILKKLSKTEGRFKAVTDLQSNEERVSVQPGNVFR